MMNRSFIRRVLFAIAAISLASGCSAYQHYQASKPDVAKKTEAMLTDAGFKTIQIDNSSAEQAGLAADLPTYELREYPISSGVVYWYYDPDFCSCVFEGNQEAFETYQMARRQQQDTADYVAESQDAEVASLNGINGMMFPPPLWIGGYHNYYGGGFLGGGSGGGGGNGGGGHHHGGLGGGGHGIGGHGGGHGGHH